ncbi:rCG64322 [Rattus norvegicus]|uniref:RCG64322 n=1 Tax=Rattus norvegicus TaxID=10116 RepID=A6IKL6_RAT|nr:rCG64322 [Rattus norvegicus]
MGGNRLVFLPGKGTHCEPILPTLAGRWLLLGTFALLSQMQQLLGKVGMLLFRSLG